MKNRENESNLLIWTTAVSGLPAPSAIRAGQVTHLETALRQQAAGVIAALASLTVDNDFPVARQLAQPRPQIIQRDVSRAGNETLRTWVLRNKLVYLVHIIPPGLAHLERHPIHNLGTEEVGG